MDLDGFTTLEDVASGLAIVLLLTRVGRWQNIRAETRDV